MKKYKVGLIHATLNSVEPILNVFKRDYKEIDTINFVDEGLLREANKQGKITNELIERFASLLQRALVSEVNAILILCSIFSPTIDEMRKRFPSIPIENVDDEMLYQAVQKGKRIGVVARVKELVL